MKISGLILDEPRGNAMALLAGHRTCDLYVAGSSPGWASPRGGLGQDTCVSLSPSIIFWCQQL